jgi:hypothetical protein
LHTDGLVPVAITSTAEDSEIGTSARLARRQAVRAAWDFLNFMSSLYNKGTFRAKQLLYLPR